MTTYSYDVRSNLVAVDLPNGDFIEYLVDGQDRRVAKKRNGLVEKQWLYRNQLNPVAELDGAGNLVARFVYAAKTNVPDFMIRAGVAYRIFSDHLGSPRVIVNIATASVVWRADYDAWGKRTVTLGAGDFVPFGFAGGIFDPDTELTRFGARDYDPTTGRWTAKDTIGFAGGQFSLYVYVGNNPINLTDSSGRVPDCDECKNTLKFVCQQACIYLFPACLVGYCYHYYKCLSLCEKAKDKICADACGKFASADPCNEDGALP